MDNRSETGKITPYVGLVYDLSKHWSAYASYTNIFKPQTTGQSTAASSTPGWQRL
ncbi:TonB-dependent receptor domain-containing protein [Cupriavidus basilensis]